MNLDERDMLLDTLRVFAFEGSAVEAGKYLFCHPNTRAHRLHGWRSDRPLAADPRSSAERFVAMEAPRRCQQPDGFV